MRTKNKSASLIALVLVVGLILTTCGPTPEPEVILETVVETVVVEGQAQVIEKEVTTVVKETVQVEVEKEVMVTPEPVARKGAWVDTMIFTSIDETPNAIAQLQAGVLDIYAGFSEDPDSFATVQADPSLTYGLAYGSWDSILSNPHGPTCNDGRLNPFGVAKFREATNFLVDRDYVVQEILGGLAVPKWVPLVSAYPDYALYADLVRPIETQYPYDFDKANELITAEMEAMGATKGADGKWQYNDQPVVIIGLIRSEDEREDIGNYFSNQLEALGFTVYRQIRTRSELAPIWQQSDPADCEWHWYTAGNYYPVVVRNDGPTFSWNYTTRAGNTTTEQNFNPTPELDALALRLETNDYASAEERRELFAQALPLALEDSAYMFIIEPLSFAPWKADLIVSSDLSSGVGGSQLWPYTIRWRDREGGTVRSAQSGILTGPWNPIAGHNWLQELMLIRATMDDSVLYDPYTGFVWPQRIERAEVVAEEGLPVTQSLDWMTLSFEPQINVPPDAWVDWDAASQTFITAAEKHPEGITAKTKTTIYYPSELWDIEWHDGSSLDLSDFVLNLIMYLDQAKTESPIYDETAVSTYDSLMSHLKGVRIVSEDPLVVETYDDLFEMEAELMLTYNIQKFFPTTNTGPLAWHSFAPGYLAEANQELAFSANKSTALGVDWTNMINGPSLEILKNYLDQAQAEGFIPYEPTLGQYITADEVEARYRNMQEWYTRKGHFWVGTGLFYLEQVNAVEGSVVMERNPDFPDPSNKWDRFGEMKIAVVDVTGPARVTTGEEATFEAYVTFRDAPYPSTDVNYVSYLLYDGAGNLVGTGEAELVADGQYKATLAADMTQQLPVGAGKIEFAVVPTVVSKPTFAAYEFVVAAP